MEETLIKFETSKLAVAKGFPRDAMAHYNASGKTARKATDYIMGSVYPKAPQSVLQKWLREEHNIHVAPFQLPQRKWGYVVEEISENMSEPVKSDVIYADTYEEALEAALIESLKTI